MLCTATVVRTSDTGSAPPSGSVTIGAENSYSDPSTCTLADVVTGQNIFHQTTYGGRCSVRITPRSTTLPTIRAVARYLGGPRTQKNQSGLEYTVVSDPSSGEMFLNANPRSVSIAVACATPAYLQGSTSCKATVSDTTGSQPLAITGVDSTPRGTVSFGSVDATVVGGTDCTLSGNFGAGVSTCSVTFSGQRFGGNNINASYTANDLVHKSANGSGSFDAARRPTQTTIACDNGSTSLNVAVPCRIVVRDVVGGVTPAGTVTLGKTLGSGFSASFDSPTCTLTGTGGTAGCVVNYTPTGPLGTNRLDHLTADYNVSGNVHVASGGATDVRVAARATRTTVTCDPGDHTPKSAAFCTASVYNADGGTDYVNGWVRLSSSGPGQFLSDTSPGDGSLCGLDTNQCTVRWIPGNSSTSRVDTITAAYVEDFDGTHSLSSSSGAGNGSVSVVGRTTTTVVSCPDVPVGDPTTCGTTVRDVASGLPQWPFGTVTLSADNGGSFDTLGQCNPGDGSGGFGGCNITYRPGAVGVNHVTASFAANGPHANSSSPATVVNAAKHGSSTATDCPAGTAGVATACTVTVTDTNGASKLNPTGTVSATDTASGSFSPASCTLSTKIGTSDKSSCQLNLTLPHAGTDSVTAAYSGGSSHTGSTAPAASFVAGKRATRTAINCDPVVLGSPINCQASVVDIDSGNADRPSGGTTSWSSADGTFDQSPNQCTTGGYVPAASGPNTTSCNLVFRATSAGSKTISAAYTGSTDYLASSTDALVAVDKRPTTTAISCPAAIVGDPVACSVVVTDTADGTPTIPSGTVTLTGGAGGSFDSTTCTLSATPRAASSERAATMSVTIRCRP